MEFVEEEIDDDDDDDDDGPRGGPDFIPFDIIEPFLEDKDPDADVVAETDLAE